MSVLMMGVSYKTAPVELRESLSIPEQRLAETLSYLRDKHEFKETVILSTCNRVEIYARPVENTKHTFSSLMRFYSEFYQRNDLDQILYSKESFDAIQHLFRVASGLDSMVIGETDVLGQVKLAYQFAQNHGTTGKITNVLFQRAIFVGKAVRTKTNISDGASSVGSVAVQLAEKIFGRLNAHRILILGAGKMAETTARHLLSQKAGDITILNRTVSKAEELAKLLKGRAGSLDQLKEELLKADIVICSTAAEKPIITKEMIEPIMRARKMKSLYFIDIAVPRNVTSDVNEIDNVYLYNIDDLKTLVEENLEHRRKDIHLAESLILGMSKEFHDWLEAALEGRSRPLRHNLE